MTDPRAADWDELARREPYFPLLTSEGLSQVEGDPVATAAFFQTGETDIASLFDAVSSLLGRSMKPAATLDFGCGVGRLTIPLAKRSGRTVGCEVSPGMLTHARQNLDRAGFRDVPLILNESLAALPAGSFDFVCSLLVFQYVPPSSGYALIRILLRLLAPGGVAALHLMLERPGDRLRRLTPFLNQRSRRAAALSEAVAHEPGRRIYRYDERRIVGDVEAVGARVAGRLPLHDGEGVFIFEKLAASSDLL